MIESYWRRPPQGLTDWQRIEGIVGYLRREFHHDSNAKAPDDCDDVVEYFLDRNGGPDYLFATTAVALIRSMGIPCRLVSGFYASPSNYDFKSGQTEVLPEDLHTWAEVYCHGVWIPIEPTPGYPVSRRSQDMGAICTRSDVAILGQCPSSITSLAFFSLWIVCCLHRASSTDRLGILGNTLSKCV